MIMYRVIRYCKNSLDIEKIAYFLHQEAAEIACTSSGGWSPAEYDDYDVISVYEYSDRRDMYGLLKEEEDARSKKRIPNYITKETVAEVFKSSRNLCGHDKRFFDNTIKVCIHCLAEIDNLEIEALQSEIRFLKKALDSAESGSYHRR